jgi:hypothetical protein
MLSDLPSFGGWEFIPREQTWFMRTRRSDLGPRATPPSNKRQKLDNGEFCPSGGIGEGGTVDVNQHKRQRKPSQQAEAAKLDVGRKDVGSEATNNAAKKGRGGRKAVAAKRGGEGRGPKAKRNLNAKKQVKAKPAKTKEAKLEDTGGESAESSPSHFKNWAAEKAAWPQKYPRVSDKEMKKRIKISCGKLPMHSIYECFSPEAQQNMMQFAYAIGAVQKKASNKMGFFDTRNPHVKLALCENEHWKRLFGILVDAGVDMGFTNCYPPKEQTRSMPPFKKHRDKDLKVRSHTLLLTLHVLLLLTSCSLTITGCRRRMHRCRCLIDWC